MIKPPWSVTARLKRTKVGKVANTVPAQEVGPESEERMEDSEEKDQKSNFEQLAKSRAPRPKCAGPENLARHGH